MKLQPACVVVSTVQVSDNQGVGRQFTTPGRWSSPSAEEWRVSCRTWVKRRFKTYCTEHKAQRLISIQSPLIACADRIIHGTSNYHYKARIPLYTGTTQSKSFLINEVYNCHLSSTGIIITWAFRVYCSHVKTSMEEEKSWQQIFFSGMKSERC
jgi:hypothetical protein